MADEETRLGGVLMRAISRELQGELARCRTRPDDQVCRYRATRLPQLIADVGGLADATVESIEAEQSRQDAFRRRHKRGLWGGMG